MIKLLSIMLPSCIFAYLGHRFSTFDPIKKKYIKKSKFFMWICIIAMSIFLGLRTEYNDTGTYIGFYESYPVLSIRDVFSTVNWSLGDNPGFYIITHLMKHFGVDSQSFVMLFALFTMGVYVWFVWKYTDDILESIYFIFTFGIYTFAGAAIKQCAAVAFGLLAIDAFFKNKKLLFVIFIIFGATIHPYVLMFLLTPFLDFKPWSKRTYYLLLLFAVIGVSLQFMVGSLIDITTMLGEEYDENVLVGGQTVNPLRFAVCLVPLVLSFLLKNSIDDGFHDREKFVILNLTMLNGEIMFVSLFGTALFFARLANYFLIFSTISLPWLFKFVNKRYRTILIFFAVICYFIYFYYANVIDQPFDITFETIGLGEYLGHIGS